MDFLRKTTHVVSFILVFGSLVLQGCSGAPDSVGPRADYAAVAEDLQSVILHEMQSKDLPALSIALVDDQEVVWSRGFGMSDPQAKIPATAQTVYRVGSVSKLFTDIAVMQLAERGELDLDAPVTDYLPDFRPKNPFDVAVTLRQLMSHRAGLVREPPVGNYFDPTEPSLAETVESLNRTELVYKPETRTKYSNAGVGTVGYVLEKTQGQPFAAYLKGAVLEPLGMKKSSFEPDAPIMRDLAKAYMWTYDGRVFQAPTFELGMAPAGCMYSTVMDLSRFMSALFDSGRAQGGRVLESATLQEMWTPQYAAAGQKSGFGIGFALSEFQGHLRIGHGGAIYGFATQLFAIPEVKVGVVAIASKDVTNSVLSRIADHALRSMLAVKEGRELPILPLPSAVDPELARRLDGRYRSDNTTVDLIERDGRLFVSLGEYRLELKALSDTLVVDDRLAYGPKVLPTGDRLLVGERSFRRVPRSLPAPVPERWKGLIGEYGWDHDTLYILEKDGKLNALIEWFFYYPLKELSKDLFAFPDYGLYQGEHLIFKRDPDGRARQVEAANVLFKRRAVGTEEGVTFRIEPIKAVDEIRAAALKARPPTESGDFREADLVSLTSLDPSIKLDIRYASANNFMSTVFYDQPKAFMQRPAAEALVRAHHSLNKKGYGLLIHDAYRPWYVTDMFWEATPDSLRIFVADPSKGSRHNRGCAVDLTLYDLKSGRPIQMVGGYDEFSPRSYPDYPGGTSRQRWHRELLRDAMEEQDFRVYEFEWWHFDYSDWRDYPIMNVTFDQIGR